MTNFIPRSIANAIDSCWAYIQEIEPTAVKHIVLNDWTKIAECCADEEAVLKPYAQANPIKYMQALVEGYEIEFDKNMAFNIDGVELSYSAEIIEGNYTNNFPIKIQVGSAWQTLSIGNANDLSSNIDLLIQELKKVRE